MKPKNHVPIRKIPADFFQSIAYVIFFFGVISGFILGSQGYTSAPDTVSWHFVFRDALIIWIPSFLTGMIFLGIARIISLLEEIIQKQDLSK